MFKLSRVQQNKRNSRSIEDSQHLTWKEFEKQKQKNSQLLEDRREIDLDNTRLTQQHKISRK